MSSSSRSQVMLLYRMLMRECQKFPSYNYRTYAVRRVQDAFRANRDVDNPKMLDNLLNQARVDLMVIKRQVVVGQLYSTQKTIVEK